jgi:hypothetical protein
MPLAVIYPGDPEKNYFLYPNCSTKEHVEKEIKKAKKVEMCKRKYRGIYEIYIIQSPPKRGRVKIGISNYSKDRIIHLQSYCPSIIKVLYVITNVKRSYEHVLHQYFGHFRSHGEWFDKAILKIIKDIDLTGLKLYDTVDHGKYEESTNE